MTPSDTLRQQIKAFESWKLEAYKCPAGVWTIGAGHTRGVTQGMKITEAEAEKYLTQDLSDCERQIATLGLKLDQGQYDALVDFTFNLGIDRLRKSTLLEYIRQGKTQLMIVRQFMRWVYSGGTVLDGLVKRRRWEAERYVGKPIYKSDRDFKWYIKKS